MTQQSKTALITGASSGIGEACARRFARGGWNLILLARREERIKKLAAALTKEYQVTVHGLSADVRQQKAAGMLVEYLSRHQLEVDLLVNNAGLAVGLEPIHEGFVDDWERMIDTNIKGLLYITRAISPLMVGRKSGHIINIGSVAGKENYPAGNVYSATKFAVDGLTKGIRIDLAPHGVKVTQVAPGAVETEFSLVRFKDDDQRADLVYKGFTPLSGNDVAEAVWFAANLPPHVNVNDLLLMPTAQPCATIIHRNT
jgi:NADP-dependent 3-hydroxy acid dehydrogenase YdfG